MGFNGDLMVIWWDNTGILMMITGWWFGTSMFFPYIGNNHPNWPIFFQRGWNHQPDFTMGKWWIWIDFFTWFGRHFWIERGFANTQYRVIIYIIIYIYMYIYTCLFTFTYLSIYACLLIYVSIYCSFWWRAKKWTYIQYLHMHSSDRRMVFNWA